MNGVLVNLAESSGDRSQANLACSAWNLLLCLFQLLAHLLTRPVNVHIVAKYERHNAQSAATDTSTLHNVGNVGKSHFKWRGYVLLNLLCAKRGSLSDDLYLIVGNIRCGIKWQLAQ